MVGFLPRRLARGSAPSASPARRLAKARFCDVTGVVAVERFERVVALCEAPCKDPGDTLLSAAEHMDR
jgi:hypothetical protein